MSDHPVMHSRDRLIHTAAKVGFLAELFSAVDTKQFLISDDGIFGLVEFLRHIQGEIQTAEAALQ